MSELSAGAGNQNSIRRQSRYLVVFLGILTVLTLGCGLQAMNLRRQQEQAARFREAALSLADQLAYGSDRLTSSVRGYAASGDKLYLDEFHRELSLDRNREKAVKGLLELDLKPSERDLLERSKQNSDRLVSLETEAIAQADQGHLSQAIRLVFGQPYREAKKSIMDPIEQFRAALSDRLGQESEELAQRARDWAATGFCLLVLNSLATAAVLSLFFWRRVVEPLTRINQSLSALLAGHKEVCIGYQQDQSEVGDIARSLELYRRASQDAERQRTLKSQLAEMAAALHHAETPQDFAHSLLSRLVPMVQGGYGAFYCSRDGDCRLECWGCYAGSQPDLAPGDPTQGLVAQCQAERKIILLRQLPDDYIKISSGSGQATPSSLVLAPVLSSGEVLAVIELAAFQPPSSGHLEMLEALSDTVALNLEILQRNLRTQKLALELQSYQTSLRFSQEQAERVLFSPESGL